MRVALRRTVAGDIDTNNNLSQDYRYSDDLTSKRFLRKLNAFFLPQESEITVRDMEPTLKMFVRSRADHVRWAAIH